MEQEKENIKRKRSENWTEEDKVRTINKSILIMYF